MDNGLIVANKSALASDEQEAKINIRTSATFPSPMSSKLLSDLSQKPAISKKTQLSNFRSNHSTILLPRANKGLGIKTSNFPVANHHNLNNNYLTNNKEDSKVEKLTDEVIKDGKLFFFKKLLQKKSKISQDCIS